MGRHSAPDDGESAGDTAGDTAGVAAVVAAHPTPGRRPAPGRHSRPDDEGAARDLSTDTIERIADPVLDEPLPVAQTTVIESVRDGLLADLLEAPAVSEPPAPVAEPAWRGLKQPKDPKQPQPAKPRRPEPHVSDRALLRADAAARARVIAAVVVPFVLYVVVLLVIGALDVRTLLIWIWVPLVTAGVMAGLILDLAHRAASQQAATAENG